MMDDADRAFEGVVVADGNPGDNAQALRRYFAAALADAGVYAESQVPAGGTTGQVLGKSSDDDYALAWLDSGGGSPFEFAEFGTAPFPSVGDIRLGDSVVSVDNGGIWGYDSDDIGGDVPMLRLVEVDGYPRIRLGGYGNKWLDLTIDEGDPAVIPSVGWKLGTVDEPFNSLYVTNLLAGASGYTTVEDIIALAGKLAQFSFFKALADTPAGDVVYGLQVYSGGTGFAQAVNIKCGVYVDDMHYTNMDESTPHPYFLWYNGTAANSAVWRVNAEGIMAYYNPAFATYTPGAVDFERIVQQWNTNVAEIGPEAGGTGTPRALRLLGTSVEAAAYKVGATAGIDFSGPVTNITVVKGIVTAAS